MVGRHDAARSHSATRCPIIRKEKMQKLVCDGCGMGEDVSIPEKKRTIRSVKFSIVMDPRVTMPGHEEVHEADLCDNCRGHVLANYFRVSAEGQLDVPAFLEPTRKEWSTKVGS